ncbi:DDE-type integrase/transposase/recombinase [Gluconobacter thailandicus]|uniref:Integrase catalytic domain-containing protein n=1 Tax=Gluconobacter thailandicus TaxID=257438 RepID=A0AAP9ES11_GLUTH|nr:DDE-type integrase/transposase/recombinase [Gluconobacter thailandicus]QEH96134.1 hypothetical protein FXF46_07470 [Gluconobacter thailandicus]
MTKAFKVLGFSVGHRRVRRLMRKHDIRVVRTRRLKMTTNSAHRQIIEPNLLRKNFSPTAVNQEGTADITYTRTHEGWVYLAVELDLFLRRVVGWNLETRITADLAVTVLKCAIALRQPQAGTCASC